MILTVRLIKLSIPLMLNFNTEKESLIVYEF
jgi:hypothetical protein